MAKNVVVFVDYQRKILIHSLSQTLPFVHEKLAHLDFKETMLIGLADVEVMNHYINNAERVIVVEVLDAEPEWYLRFAGKTIDLPRFSATKFNERREARHQEKNDRNGYWIVTYTPRQERQITVRTLDAKKPFQFPPRAVYV